MRKSPTPRVYVWRAACEASRIFITRQLFERKPIWRGTSISEDMQVAIVCCGWQAPLFQFLYKHASN